MHTFSQLQSMSLSELRLALYKIADNETGPRLTFLLEELRRRKISAMAEIVQLEKLETEARARYVRQVFKKKFKGKLK